MTAPRIIWRVVIPPFVNEFITLLKLTSLASVISLQELLTASQQLASVSFAFPEAYLAALVYYLGIVSVLMVLQGRLERRYTFTSTRRRLVPAVAHDAR
jgi:polar amino acid transport system permease protein